ncbi:hypothetical protein FGO68_gene12726 [Halteria grandinella]|uniref:Uncharacterized protein n=1 Tax=Halteria grandinella TaxID=5974 RepID=A0A8J8NY46_HALGN|nr:hypothetical protein FGO68_gene12726 [Halteria grandinella]
MIEGIRQSLRSQRVKHNNQISVRRTLLARGLEYEIQQQEDQESIIMSQIQMSATQNQWKLSSHVFNYQIRNQVELSPDIANINAKSSMWLK